MECCGRVFLSGYSYSTHLKEDHFTVNKKTVNLIPLECIFKCNKRYTGYYTYRDHLNKNHRKELENYLKFDRECVELNRNESSEFNCNDDCAMEVEVSTFDPPVLPSQPTISNLPSSLNFDQKFGTLLRQCKVTNKTTFNAVNNTASKIIDFLKEEEKLDDSTYVTLSRVANSKYFQEKICNEVLNIEDKYEKVTKNGGEFYVIHPRQLIEHVLSVEENVNQIFLNRTGKHSFDSNSH